MLNFEKTTYNKKEGAFTNTLLFVKSLLVVIRIYRAGALDLFYELIYIIYGDEDERQQDLCFDLFTLGQSGAGFHSFLTLAGCAL